MVQFEKDVLIKEQQRVIPPIFQEGVARRCLPMLPDPLENWKTEYDYWVSNMKFNFLYAMEPTAVLTTHDMTKVTKDVPQIKSGYSYSYDQVQRIENSKLPMNAQIAKFQKKWAETEDLLTIGGGTSADDGTDKASIVTTGTNSTAIGSAGSVTSYINIQAHIGQGISDLRANGISMGTKPIIFVCTQDVAGIIDGIQNVYTNTSAWEFIIRTLKNIHPASDVVTTKYLGATYTRTGKQEIDVTNGDTNSAFITYNPDIAGIAAGRIEQRSDPLSQITGLQLQYVERWLPIFFEEKGIIYDAATAVA